LLALIVVVALYFRTGGLFWGLPNGAHPDFSYHPDEAFHVVWAAWLEQGQIIARHFMFGGTLYYSVLNGYRHLAEIFSSQLGGENVLANTLMVGRMGSALFSITAILMTAGAARLLYGDVAGLVAAAALALFPGHAFLAQNLRPDELGTALVALTLYLSARRLTEQNSEATAWPEFISGLVLGAMLALRFPLAIFGFVPLSVLWLQYRPASLPAFRALLFDRRLWMLVFAVLLAYLVCSPYSLIYPKSLQEGLQVQWHYQSGIFEDAIGRGPGLFQYGVLMLAEAMGWPLYVLAVAAVACALWRRKSADLLLLAAVFPYLVLTSNASWVVVRYTLPLLPPLAILIAGLPADASAERSRPRQFAGLATAATLAFTLLPDFALRQVLVAPNIRDQVGPWMADHVAHGTTIVSFEQYGGDVFFRPPLPNTVNELVFPLQGDLDPAELASAQPAALLLLSEEVYGNMERLGGKHPKPHIAQLAQVLRPGGPFRIVHRFQPQIRFLGFDFSSWFRSQDYRIVDPGFRLYARGNSWSRLD